jgi:hypothetical protein
MTTYGPTDLVVNSGTVSGCDPRDFLHTMYQLAAKAPGSTTTLTGKTPVLPDGVPAAPATAAFQRLSITILGSPAGTTSAQLAAGTYVDQWLSRNEALRHEQRRVWGLLCGQRNTITITSDHYSLWNHISNLVIHFNIRAAWGITYDDPANLWVGQDCIAPP